MARSQGSERKHLMTRTPLKPTKTLDFLELVWPIDWISMVWEKVALIPCENIRSISTRCTIPSSVVSIYIGVICVSGQLQRTCVGFYLNHNTLHNITRLLSLTQPTTIHDLPPQEDTRTLHTSHGALPVDILRRRRRVVWWEERWVHRCYGSSEPHLGAMPAS